MRPCGAAARRTAAGRNARPSGTARRSLCLDAFRVADSSDGAVLGHTRSPCHRRPATARPAVPAAAPAAPPVHVRRAGRGQHGVTPGTHRPDPPDSRASNRRNGLACKNAYASDSENAAGRSYQDRPPAALRQRPQHRRGRPEHQPPRQGHLHRQPRRDLPRPPGRPPASASSISAGPATQLTSPSSVPPRTGPGSARTPAAASSPAVHAGTGAAAPSSAPHATTPPPGPGSSSRFPAASFQIPASPSPRSGPPPHPAPLLPAAPSRRARQPPHRNPLRARVT